MTIGTKLKSGGLSDWEPLGVSGDPVYRAASQILSLVSKELGPEIAQVLATPMRDDQRLSVDWYSARDGTVQPLSALDEPQRTALMATLQARLAEIEGLSQRLRQQQGETAQTYAGLLRAAQSYPGPECVFSVSGEPVLAFWGFGVPAQGAQKAVPSVVSAVRPTVMKSPEPPVSPPPPISMADSADTSSYGALAKPTQSFWQRYGWWALLAFILFMGLLSLIRGCGADFPLFGAPGGIGGGAGGGQVGEAGGAVPSGPNAPAAKDGAVSGSGGGLGLGGGMGGGSGSSGTAEPVAEAAPTITPEALKRNDLSVFGGRWALSSNNVMSTRTGLPVRIDFEFDQSGNGQSKVTETGGNVCQGSAQARILPPDTFALQSEPMRCSSGGVYKPLEAKCAFGEDRQVNCDLRGSEGVFSARFSRIR